MALRIVSPDRKRGFMVGSAYPCSPVSTADLTIGRHAIAHRRRRQTDGGLPRASLDVTCEHDARASPADGDARVARFNLSRTDTTATPNRASLDAAIEEKVAGASRAIVENTSA